MLSSSLAQQLQAELKGATVLTPGSEGYEESLKRWSETAEKRAVCPDVAQHPRLIQADQIGFRVPSPRSPPRSR